MTVDTQAMAAATQTTGRLAGRVALVTGSDSGIGQATAVAFAREGADVVVTYHSDAEGAARTRAEVEAAGRRATVVQIDTSDETSVEAMFDEAVGAFGRVDILVNNGGVDASGKPVAELDTETWDRAIRTNLYGYFFCAREFLRRHERAGGGWGRIINVSSVHEDNPNPGGADYDCSKGAVRMLTRTMALELAEKGVTVNTVAPGMVLTPFNQGAIDDPKVLEEQVQSIPMKRAAQPEEIAGLAVFIASDAAAYCTGSEFVMDGGLMRNLGQGA